jgi:hypothetical protein
LLRSDATQGDNPEKLKTKMKPFINVRTINEVNDYAKLGGKLEQE